MANRQSVCVCAPHSMDDVCAAGLLKEVEIIAIQCSLSLTWLLLLFVSISHLIECHRQVMCMSQGERHGKLMAQDGGMI